MLRHSNRSNCLYADFHVSSLDKNQLKVSANKMPYVTISNGWNRQEMIFANNLIRLQIYISFLSRATGMPNCSLYLAIVRRAIT